MRVGLELIGLAVVAGLCLGCGRGTEANRAVAGTWVFDAAGSTFPDAKQAALVDQIGSSIVYRFTPGGKFTQEPNDVKGSYRVDGRRVFLRVASIQGIELGDHSDSGQIFLGPNGTHLTIFSRDVPGETISLARAAR